MSRRKFFDAAVHWLILSRRSAVRASLIFARWTGLGTAAVGRPGPRWIAASLGSVLVAVYGGYVGAGIRHSEAQVGP